MKYLCLICAEKVRTRKPAPACRTPGAGTRDFTVYSVTFMRATTRCVDFAALRSSYP